jgi:hypothetical protein
MRTEALVDHLAQSLRPVRRRSMTRDALILLALVSAELGAFLGIGFMRSDMPVAITTPSFWWKLASIGLIAVLSAGVAIVSADPARSPQRGLRGILACVAAVFASGWLIDAAGNGTGELVRRLDWVNGLQCVWKMVALSIPPAAAFGLLVRRGAPTDRSGTALAAALSSATWGVFVFVFACPSDDPLYVAVWYTVGCLMATLLGWASVMRLSRW